MSQCPSLEWGKDARPRAEIPVLKWLLCLSLQRGILKASLCFSLSLSLPLSLSFSSPGWGRGPGKPSLRTDTLPARPGLLGVMLTGQWVPTSKALA